jgi:hypothetical protein
MMLAHGIKKDAGNAEHAVVIVRADGEDGLRGSGRRGHEADTVTRDRCLLRHVARV